MATNPIIFFDLEDTLITPVMNGFASSMPLLDNIELIKLKMERLPPASAYGVFSFALYATGCLIDFKRHMKPQLERLLDVELTYIPTVEGMMADIFPALRMTQSTTSRQDFITLWGKERGFVDWLRYAQRFQFNREISAVLFDDAVPDMTLEQTSPRDIKIQFINI